MSAIRIAEFDIWRAGYADSIITVLIAGTATPASIFTDEDLTEAADNPQTLLSRQDGDVLYGKFAEPLYTAQAYTLDIDSTDESGIVRVPLTSLTDEDASGATVQSVDGSEDVPLEDIVARVVYVRDFGEFLPTSDGDASAATNNISLENAIAAVSSGGFVVLPPGTFEHEDITVPPRVVIVGQGRDVTILQSESATTVWTIGNSSGFKDLTLDGVALTASSLGVFIANKDQTVFENVTLKRFATGLWCKGATGSRWKNFIVDGCTTNAKLHGDTAESGGAFTDNEWTGKCINSVTLGLDLEWVDAVVVHNKLSLGFEDNTASALKVRGARYTDLSGSWWEENVTNLDLNDASGGLFEDGNTIQGFWVKNFRMSGGAIALAGECEDVVFERGLLADVDVTLTTVGAAVLVKDVVEDEDVTIASDVTKWIRFASADHGASYKVTTDNVATKAWSIDLEPGERVFLEGKVIGVAETSDESGEYHITASARRPPSQLAYDTQTANFTAGLILTGHTSGATGRIVVDTDGGATGTLKLKDIVGLFQDNEIITDSSTGSATVNGSISDQNAALLSAVTSLITAREDDAGWAAVFVANGHEIELRVTGATSKTVEWTVHVDVHRSRLFKTR